MRSSFSRAEYSCSSFPGTFLQVLSCLSSSFWGNVHPGMLGQSLFSFQAQTMRNRTNHSVTVHHLLAAPEVSARGQTCSPWSRAFTPKAFARLPQGIKARRFGLRQCAACIQQAGRLHPLLVQNQPPPGFGAWAFSPVGGEAGKQGEGTTLSLQTAFPWMRFYPSLTLPPLSLLI